MWSGLGVDTRRVHGVADAAGANVAGLLGQLEGGPCRVVTSGWQVTGSPSNSLLRANVRPQRTAIGQYPICSILRGIRQGKFLLGIAA